MSQEKCPHCGKTISTERPYAVMRCAGCAALLQLENGRIVRSAPAGTNPMNRPHTNPGMAAMKAPVPEHELDREFEHELELELHVEVPKPESQPPRPNGHAAPTVVNLAEDHHRPRFTRRQLLLAAAGGGALVLILVLFISFRGGDSAPVPSIAPVAAPAPAPPPAPAAAPPAAPTPVAPPEPTPAAPAKRLLGGVPVVLEYDKAPAAAAPPAAEASVAPQPVDERAVPRARAAYQRGNQALFAGQADVAIRHYQETLRIYPGYVAGHRGLGLAYAEKGLNTEAIRHMKTYIRAVPNAKDVPLLKKRIQRLESVLNRRK